MLEYSGFTIIARLFILWGFLVNCQVQYAVSFHFYFIVTYIAYLSQWSRVMMLDLSLSSCYDYCLECLDFTLGINFDYS